jgi:hypothetical protein
MAGITLQVLAFVWLGAFLGALAIGAADFAFALAASALWLHVLDPLRATFLVAACGTLLHVGLIWRSATPSSRGASRRSSSPASSACRSASTSSPASTSTRSSLCSACF